MGLGAPAITTGYNYFGSYAVAICHGLVKTLHSITNGEAEIWTGPIASTSADADGKTTLTTTIGTIHFYWGRLTQNVDPVLDSLEIDKGSGPVSVPMPAYRGICYAVCEDVAFGGQVTPPTLQFHVERPSAGLTLSAHMIGSDAVIPEVIYDLLTNTIYGAGIDSANIDTASFVAAAETIIDEEFGVSPNIDSTTALRELVGTLLGYIDAVIYPEAGQFVLKLNRRQASTGLVTISEADMTEEPQPANSQFDETWNKTVVTFTDASAKWEQSSEQYDDPANAAIVGQTVLKTFDYPWLTTRVAAQVVAKRLGVKGGRPNLIWRVTLKPSFHTLRPGQLKRLSYSPLGVSSKLVLVKSVERGRPASPEVVVTLHEEPNRIESHDYIADTDDFLLPGNTGDYALAPTTHRLSFLPTDLKGTLTDGVLVAMNRPSSVTTGANIWWTWDPGTVEYKYLATASQFPAKGTLKCWHQVRVTNWLLRVAMDTSLDYEWLQSLQAESIELYAVVGRRDWKTVGTVKDQHQAAAVWLTYTGGRFTLLDSTTIEIEMDGGSFGSADLLLEGLSTDGVYPTVHIYFGRKSDFAIEATEAIAFERNIGNAIGDTGLVRYVKVTTSNFTGEEDIADVTATTFDRNDATMCASGTLSRNWGEHAPTAYELFDGEGGSTVVGASAPDYGLVQDLDTALGAIYAGTATADETLLAETIDDVLGAMAGSDRRYYA